jgi:16S rRNA (guanine527-N7)-methyltransferase
MSRDPSLPPEWAALRDDLDRAASTLGLAIDAGQRDRLLAYGHLIQRWTQVYNLTAVRDTREMFTHHLLDCLAVVAPMRRQVEARRREAGSGDTAAVRVLDVGSGAGLPGVVLAVMNPTWDIQCVDAVVKKITFIRQAVAELGLTNLTGVHGRVEAKGLLAAGAFDLVTSRAFSSLHDFVTLTRPLLVPNTGSWSAMKAKLAPEEQGDLPSDVEMFHVEQLQVPGLDAARCLVSMRPRT